MDSATRSHQKWTMFGDGPDFEPAIFLEGIQYVHFEEVWVPPLTIIGSIIKVVLRW